MVGIRPERLKYTHSFQITKLVLNPENCLEIIYPPVRHLHSVNKILKLFRHKRKSSISKSNSLAIFRELSNYDSAAISSGLRYSNCDLLQINLLFYISKMAAPFAANTRLEYLFPERRYINNAF